MGVDLRPSVRTSKYLRLPAGPMMDTLEDRSALTVTRGHWSGRRAKSCHCPVPANDDPHIGR